MLGWQNWSADLYSDLILRTNAKNAYTEQLVSMSATAAGGRDAGVNVGSEKWYAVAMLVVLCMSAPTVWHGVFVGLELAGDGIRTSPSMIFL